MNALIGPIRVQTGYCTTIDAWRGRCLNLFAGVEQEVTRTLLVARENGRKLAIAPTPGARIQSLARLVESERFTARQRKQIDSTLACWRAFENDRNFLAHGTRQCLTDQTGSWHVRLDIEAHDKCAMPPQRVFDSQEAADFELAVAAAAHRLRTQLRQLQDRLSNGDPAIRVTIEQPA